MGFLGIKGVAFFFSSALVSPQPNLRMQGFGLGRIQQSTFGHSVLVAEASNFAEVSAHFTYDLEVLDSIDGLKQA